MPVVIFSAALSRGVITADGKSVSFGMTRLAIGLARNTPTIRHRKPMIKTWYETYVGGVSGNTDLCRHQVFEINIFVNLTYRTGIKYNVPAWVH